ncbi:MAG: hypothetical protein Q4C58_14520 [Eubacteriales bacterium]|nr:hypothetical protein [Eubacteriales bacterium]
MKIKCKKCGKRFDWDVYSGICPKCAAYNKTHAADSGILQEPAGSYSKEEDRRQLHETDGDTGHDAGAPGRQSGSLAVKILIFLLALIPFLSVICYREIRKETIQERMNAEIIQIVPEEGNTLVFDQPPFLYPVTVSVLGQQREEPEEFEEGNKVLLAVKISAFSEGYNTDAYIRNVFLGYRYEGNDFYQKPMDFYSMSEIDSWPFGMSNSELLPEDGYALGNGEKEEGYLFFGIPKDAREPELILEADRGDGIIFLQGTISLENVPDMSVFAKEGEE